MAMIGLGVLGNVMYTFTFFNWCPIVGKI